MVFGKIIAGQLCLVLYVLHLRVRERKNYKGRIYVNICTCVYIFKCHQHAIVS